MATADELLTELERLSAQALQLADSEDTENAAEIVGQRGETIQRLTGITETFSYTDWNRLVIIHHQGNRIAASLQAARARIAHEFLDSVGGHALLECMSGVLEEPVSVGQLNERG